MKSAERKRRKYRRMKLRAFRMGQRQKAVRLSVLYYRYHYQVFGDPHGLWDLD